MPTSKTPRSRGRPRSEDTSSGSVRIQSVDRAIDILKIVSDEVSATLKIIAVTADLPTSTTHRILETLRAHGLVHFDDVVQTWAIGVETFRIGQGYVRRTTHLDLGREAMRELTEQTGETSNIAVRDGSEVVHISQVETHAPIRAFIPTGSRGPLYASGIGKALLANLESNAIFELFKPDDMRGYTPNTIDDPTTLLDQLAVIRSRGWAIDDEERYAGMRCVAAPIFNEFGEAVAGLSISGPAVRLDDDRIEAIAVQVKAAADWVTENAGGVAAAHWMTSTP